MKTIYQLCFYNTQEVLLRVSLRVFSDTKDAIAYGNRVLSTDRVCKSFKIQLLFLDK